MKTMQIMKKTLMASAVTLALAGAAQAAEVTFDVNGALGPNTTGVDRFKIDLFDWMPNNMLIRDVVPIATTAGTKVAVYSQGTVGTVSGSESGDSFAYGSGNTLQLTYQMRLWVEAKAVAESTNIELHPTAAPDDSSSYFRIFFHTARIGSDISGCGYGAAQTANCPTTPSLILDGSAALKAFVTMTDSGTNSPPGLDGSTGASDHDNGITSNTVALGNMLIDIEVGVQDPAFFLTQIAGLGADIEHTEAGPGAPFGVTVNPSNEVVGQPIFNGGPGLGGAGGNLTATYGADLRNNFACGAATAPPGSTSPCDVHVKTDANSTVLNVIPEPGSLALLGLGLAGFGIGVRRSSRRAKA